MGSLDLVGIFVHHGGPPSSNSQKLHSFNPIAPPDAACVFEAFLLPPETGEMQRHPPAPLHGRARCDRRHQLAKRCLCPHQATQQSVPLAKVCCWRALAVFRAVTKCSQAVIIFSLRAVAVGLCELRIWLLAGLRMTPEGGVGWNVSKLCHAQVLGNPYVRVGSLVGMHCHPFSVTCSWLGIGPKSFPWRHHGK